MFGKTANKSVDFHSCEQCLMKKIYFRVSRPSFNFPLPYSPLRSTPVLIFPPISFWDCEKWRRASGKTAYEKILRSNQSTATYSINVNKFVSIINSHRYLLVFFPFDFFFLFQRQKLTSPKWNRFKGVRLRWKEKIRLNNVIWRCWHMQCKLSRKFRTFENVFFSFFIEFIVDKNHTNEVDPMSIKLPTCGWKGKWFYNHLTTLDRGFCTCKGERGGCAFLTDI